MPQHAFVTMLRFGLDVKPGNADQMGPAEGAQHEVVGQPRCEPLERLTLFALQRAAERMRAVGQRLRRISRYAEASSAPSRRRLIGAALTAVALLSRRPDRSRGGGARRACVAAPAR